MPDEWDDYLGAAVKQASKPDAWDRFLGESVTPEAVRQFRVDQIAPKMEQVDQWAMKKIGDAPVNIMGVPGWNINLGKEIGSKTLGGVGYSVQDILEKAVPFTEFQGRVDEERYGAAKKAYQDYLEGKGPEPTDAQLGQMREYELRQQRESARSQRSKLAGLPLSAVKVVGEMAAAGPLIRATAAPLVSRIGATAATAVGTVAATPAMPDFWLKESQQNANEKGGNWYDLKNVSVPLARAAATNVILNQIGKFANSKAVANTASTALGRIAAKAAVLGASMPVEALGAELLMSGVQDALESAGFNKYLDPREKRYRTFRDARAGKWGDVGTKLASDALMATGFGFLHPSDRSPNERKQTPVESLGNAIESLKSSGVPEPQALTAIHDAVEPVIQASDRLTKKEIQEKFIDPMPDGPMKDYAQALLDSRPAEWSAELEIAQQWKYLPKFEEPPPPPFRTPEAIKRDLPAPTIGPAKNPNRPTNAPPPKPAEPPRPVGMRDNPALEDFFGSNEPPLSPKPAPKDIRDNKSLDDVFADLPVSKPKAEEGPAPWWKGRDLTEADQARIQARWTGEVDRPDGGKDVWQNGVIVQSVEPAPAPATKSTFPPPERRINPAERKRVADMTPEERAKELLTSPTVDLPNRRAFDEAGPAKFVGMSDADGLKAFNDKFGYEAGDALLRAKAEALKEAGLDAYHEKGDEFLYRGEDQADLTERLNKARAILRERPIQVTMTDGTVKLFKGADFSFGVGNEKSVAESGLKAHKAEREARGERARGELRGIVEVGQEPSGQDRSPAVRDPEQAQRFEPGPEAAPEAVEKPSGRTALSVEGAEHEKTSDKKYEAHIRELEEQDRIQREKDRKEGIDFEFGFNAAFNMNPPPTGKRMLMASPARDARKPVPPEPKQPENPEPKVTALAREMVSKDRMLRGEEEVVKAARRADQELWDAAVRERAQDPTSTVRIIADILAGKAVDADRAGPHLLLKRIELNNAEKEVMSKGGDPEVVRRAVEDIRTEMGKADLAADRLGSKLGRGLRFYRVLAAEDYSLAGMLGRATVDKGRPLDQTEIKKIEEMAKTIADLNERLQLYRDAPVEVPAPDAKARPLWDRAKDFLKNIFKLPEGKKKDTKAWEWADKLEKGATDELMKKFGPNSLFSGFDPAAIPLLAKYTAAKIVKSGLTFADFSKRITDKFGDEVKPHLDAIWSQAKKLASLPIDQKDHEIAIEKEKDKYEEYRKEIKRSQYSTARKVWEGAKETGNVIRLWTTASDLSAMLRQGGLYTLSHPIKAFTQALPRMIDSAMSERTYDRRQYDLKHSKDGKWFLESGGYLSNLGHDINTKEEAFISRLLGKRPTKADWKNPIKAPLNIVREVVSGSERAYTAFLNEARVEMFRTMRDTSFRGQRLTKEESKQLATFVNDWTGRATLPGAAEKSAAWLANWAFSPRYLWSRVRVLTGANLAGGNMATRKAISLEYARAAMGLAAFYGIVKLLNDDAKISFDPRSSDFGKIRFGNYRLDPLTGLSQLGVFLARVTTGEFTSTETGRSYDLRKPVFKIRDPLPANTNPNRMTTGKVILNFSRNKMAPLPGMIHDVLSGTRPANDKPPTASYLAGQALVPISVRDVYEAMNDQGFPRSAALAILAILGMGTQLHDKKK